MKSQGQKLKTLFIILLLLGGPAAHAFQVTDNFSISSKNRTWSHKSNNGLTSTELEYRGEIVFTDDDRDVKSISNGGFLKFSQRSFGVKRTIILEGNSGGRISREYYEGRTELPFEPDGRKWMEDVLVEIIRSTGIGAEQRVARFYKKGGMDAVIEEIDEISSDYVQSKYFGHAVNYPGIKNSEIQQVTTSAADMISSSYELAKFFISGSKTFLKDNETANIFLENTAEISSDYEQARVLKHVIKEYDITEANAAVIIKGTKNISSDYEQSKVLLSLMEKDLSKQNLKLVQMAMENISSSYEKSRILKYLIEKQEPTTENVMFIIDASSQISSDYEQAKVFKMLLSEEIEIAALAEIAKATQSISSDYEQSKVLQAIAIQKALTAEVVDIIVHASMDISSDYEQGKVFKSMLESNKLTAESLANILEAASEISSSYEKSKLLKSVIEKGDLKKAEIEAVLNAAEDISSSYDKSKVLIALAPKIAKDDLELRELFRQVAKTISSDHDYGKAMRSLDN